ncbi:MAG: tail fiber domain-containing protein [Bacteroidales bacterium]
MYSNTSGTNNTATGYLSLSSNTSGDANTAFGNQSLRLNTAGYRNTGYGNGSLYTNTTGDDNTAIGFNADVSTGNLNNATAIGAWSVVSQSNSLILETMPMWASELQPQEKLDVEGYIRHSGLLERNGITGGSGTNYYNLLWTGTSAQLWIDNVNVGTIQLTSDRRLKDEITPMTGSALDRIKKLQPVTFRYTNLGGSVFTGDDRLYEGFIADELQQVIPSAVNGEKDALTAEGDIQPQTLNYAPILSVLTKAIQEQQTLIETLKLENEELNVKVNRIDSVQAELDTIKAQLNIQSTNTLQANSKK